MGPIRFVGEPAKGSLTRSKPIINPSVNSCYRRNGWQQVYGAYDRLYDVRSSCELA